MKKNKSNEKNPIMESTKKQILKDGIIAILILLCFVGIFVVFSMLQDSIFSRTWQIITMAILFVSIIIFEIAYKKDNGIIAINGIEILVFACIALTLEYIKTRFGIDVKLFIIIAGCVYTVYYLLKVFIVYTSGRKKVLNSLSDIAEIVKEDEPKKKEAKKHYKGE